jgi:hypothetical protein
VAFHGKSRLSSALAVGLAEAYQWVEGVCAVIEYKHKIGDVHVAVVIEPFG